MNIEWKRGRERLITDDTLVKLPDLDQDELQSTPGELGQLEQEVSQQRRRLHQVIDRMEADLAARHKVGEA
jgi:RsiG-like